MFGSRFAFVVALMTVSLVAASVPRGLAAPTPKSSVESAPVPVEVRLIEMPIKLAREELGDRLEDPGAVILDKKEWYEFIHAVQHHGRANILSAPLIEVQSNEWAVFHVEGVTWRYRMSRTQDHNSHAVEVARAPSGADSNLQVTIEAELDPGDALVFGGGRPRHHADAVLIVVIKPVEARQGDEIGT